MSKLSDRDCDVLAFEAHIGWSDEWSKAQAVRELFDLTLTSYTQILNAACAKPEARAIAPQMVKRFERIKTTRRRGAPIPSGNVAGRSTKSNWLRGPKPLRPL